MSLRKIREARGIVRVVFMLKSEKTLRVKGEFSSASSLSKRKSPKKVPMVSLPNLIEAQTDSYRWFLEKGFQELLDEINPITDFAGKDLEISISDYYLDEPKYDEITAKNKNISFEAPLRAKASLLIKRTGEIREQEIYLGDFPIMTDRGTFVVNGVERVVVSQLIRSPGVFFTMNYQKGKKLFGAKIIPNRGAWLEIDTDFDGVISVKIDRKRKVPITALLRAFGYGSDEKLRKIFTDTDNGDTKYIEETISKDISKNQGEGYKEVYKRIRPGDFATEENAKQMIDSMFFNFERYDFGSVGRYRLNQRLRVDRKNNEESRVLNVEDLILIIKEVIKLNNDPLAQADDIDHLGNRRVRGVGELVQNKLRVGMARMIRNIKDRMSTCDVITVVPGQLVNSRPIAAAIKEFFSSSQLSQFMDQVNPLAELEHKRRLSAMGPGGLTRERAGFEVRDVHHSHYGRICPVQTPEGPNIGLVGHMATYARINKFGFLETPYRKIEQEVENKVKMLINKILGENISGVAKKGEKIDNVLAEKIVKSKKDKVKVFPFITETIEYIDATVEDRKIIAHAGIEIDKDGNIMESMVEARVKGHPEMIEVDKLDYIDVSAKQCISVATSMIPFLEHDDANRALMGSNMQRQAVSCVVPEAPVVGTGIEDKAAADSGQVVISYGDGTVIEVDARHIIVKEKTPVGSKKSSFNREYILQSFIKSNAFTSMNQIPRVKKGDDVHKGQLLADGASTDHGELALGQNVMVAFIPWEGYNFEDAIIVSERVLQADRYSSIHIEDFSVEVRDTKLGPEVVTRDIPNIGEERLKNLDETGIIRIGAEVSSGDIMVGKITPKGEGDLTAEERLLRAIFGEKSRDVKDSSLYLPHGEHGKVVDIKIFSREQGDKLSTGVIQKIQVSVAQLRKISVGDKLAGRHGNKGVISRIAPVEDMPYLPDGNPVDIILNPLGVASRMNIGQILETHLGWAAKQLGYNIATPALDGVSEDYIKEELKKAGLPEDGKVRLVNGKTGEYYDNPSTVGIMYIMKLNHLVDDKLHMRSIGPYSLITQQPLGGKAQFGGQRFGEMEVWALEGYGAAHTLQEMLTIKSDDVMGRSKAYESIIKGEPITSPNIPASFHVLVNELKGLCLNVQLLGGHRESGEKEDE
ncbi:MAG: DNA-directed RNA polymerase subunit beta [Candidatus Moranbacteria bacterium GW2011_GWE2_35_2-]|nr:MAG: DNA-directed RNA polymerase subunit beta [Candidatus Moranbacteria bacterium GW2011_GWE2_35_2-]KKQ22396.1 MAG: DNA-directed RNA polymerase subunit beta [Candidatus Moranbacteria bacterium GW2011_GWF2_37_11]KKQ29464.1 MAG: DNA-directed RNA polymerase subunit beta [Candidatus Moranbacteria bacterium GW2011_GWD1_37_17]KKQ30668.1 MAG: DNA-directed RNA polymerase subunit beta [Candidatus Moranbacteria bacterium GW2011_GWE1_37_24]KKQ47770.1 MAG: DNA-directed RNA polymerase subunit beta [Candi